MHSIEQAVSQNIRKIRLQLKLSQEDLAFKAGVDRSYLSQVECGLKSPTLRFLSKISLALDCTPQSLFESKMEQPTVNNRARRVEAGRLGRQRGHQFEREYAQHLGLSAEQVVRGGSKTKVDIETPKQKFGNLSIKNPSGVNTQVFLTSPRSFKSAHSPMLSESVVSFIDLFFGTPVHSDFESLLKKNSIRKQNLSTDEIDRQRVFANNLPAELVEAMLDWLNNNHDLIFKLLFVKGYPEWEGEVDALGWAWKQDDVGSVKIYKLKNIFEIYNAATWKVAKKSTVLNLIGPGEKKYLHLQMKSSGPKNEWGYHGMMFHMYSAILKNCKPM